jgi:MoaA/NifB/PqqE/SkfB family radical SAM enzyme
MRFREAKPGEPQASRGDKIATAGIESERERAHPRLRRRFLERADLALAYAFVSSAIFDRYRPLLVFLNITRRCNLSCGYCCEYDRESLPVPREVLRERIDHLARLLAVVVTLNGGEPLLHPDVVEIVAAVRERGMIPAVNTNGFLLSRELIEGFNRAGLHTLQISADAVHPNALTAKALKSLLPAFGLLAEHARFRVRVNTVLGAASPEEALEVARTALAYGFDAKCALLRTPCGAPEELDERALRIHEAIDRLRGRGLSIFSEVFQSTLLRGGRVDWKCRAGARYFHVCEDGRVRLCGARLADQGKPLVDYGPEDIRRAFHARKPCASRCAIAYAHQVSRIDRFRGQE